MTEKEIVERLQRGQSIFEGALLALICDKDWIIKEQDREIMRLRSKVNEQGKLLQNLTICKF